MLLEGEEQHGTKEDDVKVLLVIIYLFMAGLDGGVPAIVLHGVIVSIANQVGMLLSIKRSEEKVIIILRHGDIYIILIGVEIV